MVISMPGMPLDVFTWILMLMHVCVWISQLHACLCMDNLEAMYVFACCNLIMVKELGL
jgi:hypothetical protein